MSGGNLDDVDSVLDFDDYRNILDSKYVYYKKNCDNIKYHFRDSNSNVSEIIKLIIQKTLTVNNKIYNYLSKISKYLLKFI